MINLMKHTKLNDDYSSVFYSALVALKRLMPKVT
jgi:hypothetical protein